MSSSNDFLDDLVALSRRGALPDAEQRHLRDGLSASPETSLFHEAGQAFDLEAPVEPGDDELCEQMLLAVQRGRSRPRLARRRRVFVAVAACILLVGAAAGAFGLSNWMSTRASPQPAAEAARDHAQAPTPGHAVPLRSVSEAPRPEATDVNAVARFGEPESEHAPKGIVAGARSYHRPAIAPSSASRPEIATAAPPSTANFDAVPAANPPAAALSASQLFAAANAARVRGDVPSTLALYEALETNFPASSEASSAHLSLGMLYLRQRQPERALQSFQLAAGNAPASAEVLWGEAQALRQLGRSQEEKDALSELLKRHPEAAYAAAARKRLKELE